MSAQVHDFHGFHLRDRGRCPYEPVTPGRPRHAHSTPCPCCRRWTAPYDDDPWPEGREWTSAHYCRRCEVCWTQVWEWPTGAPVAAHEPEARHS